MALFTNQAQLSYNGTVINSNVVTGEIRESVTATKTAVSPSYTAGGRIAYAVTVDNDGASAINGVTVTDDLGGYEFEGDTVYPLSYVEGSVRYFVDGELQAPPEATVDGTVTFSGIDIPAGETAFILYEARVTAFAPGGADAEITNTATVSGGGIIDPVTASATVPAEDDAILSITKSLEPTSVTENGIIEYTFVITNSGATAADEELGIVLSDNFEPILSDIEVTLDGDPLDPSSYAYNEQTGLFTTDEGVITVPAATFTRDPASGEWITVPGVTTLTVTGRV